MILIFKLVFTSIRFGRVTADRNPNLEVLKDWSRKKKWGGLRNGYYKSIEKICHPQKKIKVRI